VAELFDRGVEVLPPGTRLERFPPNLEPRTGPVRILFASALDDRRKGLDVAVRAFGRLLDDRPEARLILAGPGDPAWALAGAGAAVLAATDVLGVGELTDVAGRYQTATMTILPAQDEAFGLVLVESLASGTPVICADQGGMPAIVEDEKIGRVVPFGDDVALAAAMAGVGRLAREPGTPSRCADHARSWDWTISIGPAHEDLYTKVVAGSAGAGRGGAEPRVER
jgi:phosphatidylinositol alpha-mannosyltransferase